MDFHSYITHVLAARPSGTTWCTEALHPVLDLCTAATWLEDTVRAGQLGDAITRAAIVVSLESLEEARALVCFHHAIDPRPPARLARRGPSLARAARQQASLSRAMVAVAGGRPAPPQAPGGGVRGLLRSLDRQRAYLYRALGLTPEDIWRCQGWGRVDGRPTSPPIVASTGRWRVFA